MAAGPHGQQACLLCKQVLESEDRRVECRVCWKKWHCKCVEVKDSLVLAMEVGSKRNICFICERCGPRIDEWRDGPSECKRRSTDGATDIVLRGLEEGENETENDFENRGMEDAAKTCEKNRQGTIMELQNAMEQLKEELCQNKKECEQQRIQMENIKSVSENEKKIQKKIEEKLKIEMEEDKQVIKELQAKIEDRKQDYIVDDVLVFITTKMSKIPKTEVLELAGFFNKEEIGKAKETLFNVCKSRGAEEDGIKYEKRRNSTRRGICSGFRLNSKKKEMPKFVTMNADNRSPVENKWMDAILINENVGKIRQWVEEFAEETKTKTSPSQVGSRIEDSVTEIKEIMTKMDEDKQGENQEAHMRREAEGLKFVELQGRLNKMETIIRELIEKNWEQNNVKCSTRQNVPVLQNEVMNEDHGNQVEAVVDGQKELRWCEKNNSSPADSSQNKERGRRRQMSESLNDASKINEMVTEANVQNNGRKNSITSINVECEAGNSNGVDREAEKQTEDVEYRRKETECDNKSQSISCEEMLLERKSGRAQENDRRKYASYASAVKEQEVDDKTDWKEVINSRRQGRNKLMEVTASGRGVKCYVGKCGRHTNAESIKAYVEGIVRKELKQEVECIVTD